MQNHTTEQRSTRGPVDRTFGTYVLAALAIVAIVVGLVIASSEVKASSDTPTRELPTWMHRACADEDSVNCYWDADASGNGRGHSFYVRQFPGRERMVCVMYVKPRDAKRWDYCESTR